MPQFLPVGLGLFLAGMPGLACAQIGIPANQLPGAILQPMTSEETARKQPAWVPEKKAPVVETPAPVQAPESDHPDVAFVVQRIAVDAEDLPPPEVMKHTQAYLNKKLPFSAYQQLAAELTEAYHDLGYVTHAVLIPPQTISDGTLRLQVKAGKINTLDVAEGRYTKKRFVRHFLTVKPRQPLNVLKLQDDLARMNNRNPDARVDAVIQAADADNTYDVTLNVQDQRPVHLLPSVDNLGRELIGKNRVGLQVQHTNLLGYGDEYLGGVTLARHSQYYANRYAFPLGKHRPILRFEQNVSAYRLGKTFRPANIQGHAAVYSAVLEQPLIVNDKRQLTLELAGDVKNQNIRFSGLDLFEDRVRVLRTGMALTNYDTHGLTFLRQDAALGLDAFGATSGDSLFASRAGAGNGFLKLNTNAVRYQQLGHEASLILRAQGQYSPDRLTGFDTFQLGGAYSVRGYPEGHYIGDSGVAISAETRMPLPIPATWQVGRKEHRHRLRDLIRLVIFLDGGKAFVRHPQPGEKNQVALGAGVGIRAQLTRRLAARVDVGIPLVHHAGEDLNRFRLHFGIESQVG